MTSSSFDLKQNGNIYGAPFHCYAGYYTYRPEAWAEAGLSVEDIPASFVEYQDFLEIWILKWKAGNNARLSIPLHYVPFFCKTAIRAAASARAQSNANTRS